MCLGGWWWCRITRSVSEHGSNILSWTWLFPTYNSLGVCVVLFVHSFPLMKMDLCLYIHFLSLDFPFFSLSLFFFLWTSKYIILKVPDGKVSYLFHMRTNPSLTWLKVACLYAKLLQLCLTLCNSMNCNPPGSSAHGILQARILEGVAMPFSRGSRVGSSQPRDQTCIFSPFLHWQMGSSPLAPPGKDLEPFCKRCQSRDQRRGNLLLLVPFIHSALME